MTDIGSAADIGLAARSPLPGMHLSGPGEGSEPALTLAELPHLATVAVRGASTDADVLAALSSATGLDPPIRTGRLHQDGDTFLACVAPDEWLLIAASGREEALVRDLEQALAGRFAAVVDLTDNGTHIRIGGGAARDVLACGCPVDLHPSAFGPGSVTRTLLDHVDVTLLCALDPPGDMILGVRRSFAAHIRAFLVTAGGLDPASTG